MKAAQNPNSNSPPESGVIKKFDRIEKVLDLQQVKVFRASALSIDTARSSRTKERIAREADLLTWKTVQELHYIDQVKYLFRLKCVQQREDITREEMFRLFPTLAPIEKLGLSQKLCWILRDKSQDQLKDGFGRKRNLSIRYIRELYSLSLNEDDLLEIVRGYWWNQGYDNGKAVARAEKALSDINLGLEALGLPVFKHEENIETKKPQSGDSEHEEDEEELDEHKALSRLLTKSLMLQRSALSQRQIMILHTLYWGNLSPSDVFPGYDLQTWYEKVETLEIKALKSLLKDDLFERASLFRFKHQHYDVI